MHDLLSWLDELALFVGATVFDIPTATFLSGVESYESKVFCRGKMLTVVALGIQRKFFEKTAAKRLRGFKKRGIAVRVEWGVPDAAIIRFLYPDVSLGESDAAEADKFFEFRGCINVGKIFQALKEGNYVRKSQD